MTRCGSELREEMTSNFAGTLRMLSPGQLFGFYTSSSTTQAPRWTLHAMKGISL